MEETGRLVAVVLLASFAIERVAAIVDFLSEGMLAVKHRRLVRIGVSALLALGVVVFTGIRILGAMKFPSPSSWIDFLLTWLILAAGADKIDQFVGDGSSRGALRRRDDIRPIQIFIDKNDVTEEALQSAP
jgi:hypothetical protein